MSKDVESKVVDLKERLAQDDYRVDAQQVADAILHRPASVLLFAVCPARSQDKAAA